MSWIVPTAKGAQEYFEDHPDEASFMKYFGDVFQVSYANRYKTQSSEYAYYLMKAHPKPAERYGLNGEILVLYAPYPEVQARSIIDATEIQQKNKERVHPIWNILITDDPETQNHLQELTVGKDLEVYSIPFSRQELENKPTAEAICLRLEQFIHGRDLFAFQSALRNDTFFFGRKELVDNIIGQIENGQNFGLFGLRKIGKTSVLLAVERYLNKLGTYKTIHIDCQNPGIYLMKWTSLIANIYSEVSGQPTLFVNESDQVALLQKAVESSRQKILVIFDEIENISFGDLSPAKHWEQDFLPFWGAIRAIHQQSNGKLTFGVAGVNPYIFDIPLVSLKDNPILLGVSPLYLTPLNEESVKEMVRTIGRYMGITFTDDVYHWLFSQYGGHPFLARKACSLICRKANKKSGDTVSLSEFISREKWLDDQLGKDIMNILVVLTQHYPEEFDNLISLAKGEQDWLKYVRTEEPERLRHIIEYGLVKEENDKFIFVIEALQSFLVSKGENFKKSVQILTKSSQPTNYIDLPDPNQLEYWSRIGAARNKVEPLLRSLLYRALCFKYGEKQALQRVLEKFNKEKQKTLSGYSLDQIFSGESKALYLKDTIEIALREWDLIKHIFGDDKKSFEINLEKLNSEGRADAHARPISEAVVLVIENIADDLNKVLTRFLVT
jgi:hypothetical protein